MPIYEYQCRACGHELDALQKISEPPLVSCPECEEDSLRRMISAPRFRLKGSGWYETDFKKDGRRNLADGGDKREGEGKAKGEAEKKADKPSETKETKPAKKASGTGND